MRTLGMLAGTLLLAGAVHAQDAASNARYLAANCANCHGTTGVSVGAMPALAGLDKAYLVEQMRAFRDGKRPATIMHQIAKGYTDPQVELIADFFSRQKPAR